MIHVRVNTPGGKEAQKVTGFARGFQSFYKGFKMEVRFKDFVFKGEAYTG
jgi:hypothetical protein